MYVGKYKYYIKGSGLKLLAVGGPLPLSYAVLILFLNRRNNLCCSWCFPICDFFVKNFCVVFLFYWYRQYLETRSLNQRLDSQEIQNLDRVYEEDSHEGTCKDRDRDWHHYSKSSGRSGRSRRSSRRRRDRRRKRSHSRHKSPSVREPAFLLPSCLNHQMGYYRLCLANA